MIKKILIVAAVLLLLGFLLLVGGGFYVVARLNSDETREQIRSVVAEKTGVQIELGRHRISLLGEVVLEALAVPNAAPHEKTPLLALEKFEVKVSPLSLFSGAPVVNRILIEGADVHMYQNSEGGFTLPFAKKDSAPSGDASDESAKKADTTQLSATVESIEVNRVNVQVYDTDMAVLAAVKDLSAKGGATLTSGKPVSQLDVTIGSLVVTPGIKAGNVRTPVAYDGGKAQLSKISAEFAQGRAEGRAQADLSAEALPFEVDLNVAEARMEDVLKDIGGNPDTLRGALKIDFKGGGSLNAPKELTGKGSLTIADAEVGKLRNPILPAGLLGVSALQTGKFDSIEGTYHIEGQQVVVDDLKVLSKGLQVGLTGTVGFDKVLNLQGRLIVDSNPISKVADVAQGFMQGLLGKKKEEGAPPESATASEVLKGGVPFTVTGNSDSPVVRPVSTDPLNLVSLIAKALGFQVDQAPTTPDPAPTEADGTPVAPPPNAEGAPAETPKESTGDSLKKLLPF
jgi:hypothetical protein